MRRALVLVLLGGAVLASTAGAAERLGTARGETIRGSARGDFIDPRGGRDRVHAGRGDDLVKAQDQFIDRLSCGPGFDVACNGYSDAGDPALCAAYAGAGATWWLENLHDRRLAPDELLARVAAGPAR